MRGGFISAKRARQAAVRGLSPSPRREEKEERPRSKGREDHGQVLVRAGIARVGSGVAVAGGPFFGGIRSGFLQEGRKRGPRMLFRGTRETPSHMPVGTRELAIIRRSKTVPALIGLYLRSTHDLFFIDRKKNCVDLLRSMRKLV